MTLLSEMLAQSPRFLWRGNPDLFENPGTLADASGNNEEGSGFGTNDGAPLVGAEASYRCEAGATAVSSTAFVGDFPIAEATIACVVDIDTAQNGRALFGWGFAFCVYIDGDGTIAGLMNHSLDGSFELYTGVELSAGRHLLGLDWDGDHLRLYVDGVELDNALQDPGSIDADDLTEYFYLNPAESMVANFAYAMAKLDGAVGPTVHASFYAAMLGQDDDEPEPEPDVPDPCITVELNSFMLDGTTADADDVLYDWQSIDGWWDGADAHLNLIDDAPEGQRVPVARQQSRQITLKGYAHHRNPNRALGVAVASRAIRRIKAATQLLYVPGLLTVIEPDLALQALVRLVDSPPRFRIEGGNVGVMFEIPLMAADPRRYNATETTDTVLALTGSGTVVTDTIATGGDKSTAPVFTIDGPAVNPYVRNVSNPGSPFVQYNGTLGGGDTLIIDMGAHTAEVNGTSVVDDLSGPAAGPPFWWELAPGNNTCRYGRSSGTGTSTASCAFRDAYS